MVACVRTVRTLSGLRYPWKSGRHGCAKPAQPIQIRSPVPLELHLLYHGDAPHGAFFLYACRISAAFVRLCLAASGARLMQGASSTLVNTLHKKQCKKPLSRTLFLFFFCFLVKTSTSANQYRLSQRFTKCADPLPPRAHSSAFAVFTDMSASTVWPNSVRACRFFALPFTHVLFFLCRCFRVPPHTTGALGWLLCRSPCRGPDPG